MLILAVFVSVLVNLNLNTGIWFHILCVQCSRVIQFICTIAGQRVSPTKHSDDALNIEFYFHFWPPIICGLICTIQSDIWTNEWCLPKTRIRHHFLPSFRSTILCTTIRDRGKRGHILSNQKIAVWVYIHNCYESVSLSGIVARS